MAVDFCKKPRSDVAPVKLDFYKPEHVVKLNNEIKAGEIVASEKKLEAAPVVPVVMPEIIVAEPVIEPIAEEVSVVDTGASDEVVKAINKGRQ